MSADDHLSPSQFGFTHHSEQEWGNAMDSATERSSGFGRLNLQKTELHTGQRGIFPDQVNHYVQNPGQASVTSRLATRVETYHDESGRVWVGEGHHRIAAAKARGQKTIRVERFGHPADVWKD